jgi:hypothetical protein
MGTVMMITPAVAHALPLTGSVHTAVLVLAVLVGSAGALIVFGGLLIRAVLEPAALSSTGNTRSSGIDVHPATPATPAAPAVDDALLSLPHPRIVWIGLVLLAAALGAGALCCLALLITGHGAQRLPEFLLLGLPACALGWAAWRGRVMRATVAPPGQAQTKEPVTLG